MGESGARAKLGAIRAVTYAVADLAAIEAAYAIELGYQIAARGRISEPEARAWGAPAVAGRRSLTLGPASGEAVHLRFVESPAAAGWRALKTFGWNATEFVVEDVDALAMGLEGGAFTIIGPPKGLTRFPMIRAMQVVGPAGECCYFTEVGPGSGLDLARARAFVGRVFIVVAAGADADHILGSYARFANPIDSPVATPVKVISDAHGLPETTLHRHGLVRLPGGCLIEVDAYPSTARPRAQGDGELPPGMAMVTFTLGTPGDLDLIAPPAPSSLPGAAGFAGSIRGAAGELIEVVSAELRHQWT